MDSPAKDAKDAKDKAFWDKSAPSYSKSKVSDQQGYERTLALTKKHLQPSDSVLELGCGTGSSAFLLAPSTARYLATDISPEMIRIATEKHASHPQTTNLVFRAATAESLAAAEESRAKFNAVLGYNYLHLVHEPWATVRSVRDMLVDGGLFISKTPCLKEMNPLMRYVLLPVMQAVGKAPHVESFTRGELRRGIEEAGFEVLEDEVHASKGDDGRPFIVARRV